MLLSKYLKVKANYKVKRASSVPDIIFSMCGRFSLDQYPDTIIKALNVGPVDFKPRSQVYPTNSVDVVFCKAEMNIDQDIHLALTASLSTEK